MPLPPDFPLSPHAVLEPGARWMPDETDPRMEKLPPLVQELRERVKAWRDKNYEGATDTSRSLLRWWFQEEHQLTGADGVAHEFRYYFAQREAVETIIYLYEVAKVKDKFNMMRFTSSGAISPNLFDEDWLRFVIKMATGSGKTKVLSLALAWCYFHKCYEADSQLARNFLIITPNIIVLDRLKKDFNGLRVFYTDPVLPDNGYDGHNWRDDFQLTVHLQDEVRTTRPTGNIFLTNIHRVYSGDDIPPSPDDDNTMDYFLGKRPTGATTDSKVDLGAIVRDIDELAVFNDEAHHIHDKNLAWFKSIEDIHNRLKQKGGGLALQVDTSATPKHNNGAIFVQTVADYPLVEAIAQNVVKHPVIPDAASRNRLEEQTSSKFSERYADYLKLGVMEWRKADAEHRKMGKKSILFVMTDDTKNCDEVAEYLENTYPELRKAVLVIHTKKNGEISEANTGKPKEELEKLRKEANEIDGMDSPYKAIVSVIMLKEGWDVRNVTTIVGLRAYTAASNILPEQTLGRGLRWMYPDADADAEEKLSVIGTDAFMDFVEAIEQEGVTLEREEMGPGGNPKAPMVIEVDTENPDKNIQALDIEIPILTPRTHREYDLLDMLDSKRFDHAKIPCQQFSEQQKRDIVFHYLAKDEISHTTELDAAGVSDYRAVVGFFSRRIMQDLRLVSVYDVVYEKVKNFIRDDLFEYPVDLEDRNTLRNLSESAVTKSIIEIFKKQINVITLRDKGAAELRGHIKVSATRPFVVKQQKCVDPQKSVFNKIIGDSSLELDFAEFLEQCGDIISYAKNYFAVGFRLDYVNARGDVANYFSDFLVKKSPNEIYIVETKGREELSVPQKMERLKQWCEDVNSLQNKVRYDFVYVDEEGFEKYHPKSFDDLVAGFRCYK